MASFSEDDDLDTVWPKIISYIDSKAEWKLDQAGARSSTMDAVLAKINPPKKKTSVAEDVTKKVFQKSLVCVKRLTGVVAQSASLVFGPSQQCFNAISFVVDAAQRFEEVFANVTVLVERMSAFLERLCTFLDQKEAEEKLDRRLRVPVYKVLEHFLTVLAIWHKLTYKKSHMFKVMAKIVIFGEDDGVKDAMTKLETLVSEVTKVQIDVILQTVSAQARDIHLLVQKLDQFGKEQEKTAAGVGRLENAEESRTRLEQIQAALSPEPNKRTWEQTHDEFGATRVAETGQWLLDYDMPAQSFTRWADTGEVHDNALAIVGGEQYRKSYLCSVVVNHLRERHKADNRVGVAYYYIQRDMIGGSRINNALKSVIYQLASAHTSLGRDYSKLIQKACVDYKNEFVKSSNLWNRLVIEHEKSLDATFFIVIDGIDKADAEQDNPFAGIVAHTMSLTPSSSLKIRLLFSARSVDMEAFANLPAKVPHVDIAPSGESAPLNEPDILLFAQRELGEMQIFKGEGDEVSQLEERAKTELGHGVRGDYYALKSKLERLRTSRTVEEVNEVLERAKDDRIAEIEQKIDQLNETLREDEVRELNEILCWEAVCFEALTLDQYKRILELNTSGKILIPLDTQIKERYSRLLTIDETDMTVTLKSTDIGKYLQEANSRVALDSHGRQISQTAIQEGEIQVIKSLLKTYLRRSLGSNDIYERFGFEAFFKEKLGSEALRIKLLPQPYNHIQVARGCLRVICDHSQDDNYSQLRHYAWEYFVGHLLAGRDVEDKDWIKDVDSADKQFIGRKLVRVLRDASLLKSKHDECHVLINMNRWVFRADYSIATQRWLKDADVQKGLRDTPTDYEWVLESTKEGKPAVTILQDVCKAVARHWLDQNGEGYSPAYFIHGYLSSIQNEKPGNLWDDRTVEQINAIEQWARKELSECTDESKWQSCLAATLRNDSHAREALDRLKKWKELGGQDWNTSLSMAQLLRNTKDALEGVRELESLIENNQSLLTTDEENEYKTEYWTSVLPELARCYVDIDDFTAAERTYRQILDEAVRRGSFEQWAMNAVTAMAKTFNQRAKHEDTVQLFEELAQRPHENLDSWLHALLHFYASAGDEDLHKEVRLAARGANRIGLFVEAYQALISDTATRKASSLAGATQRKSDTMSLSSVLQLRYFLALLLWSDGLQEEQQMAVDLWEENILVEVPRNRATDYTGWQIRWVRRESAARLGRSLFAVAKATGLSSPLSPAVVHMQRLEKLIQLTSDEMAMFRFHLVRLTQLSGDAEQARKISLDMAQKALDGAETTPGQEWTDAITHIVMLLLILDDDMNALAVYQAHATLAPNVKKSDQLQNESVAKSNEDGMGSNEHSSPPSDSMQDGSYPGAGQNSIVLGPTLQTSEQERIQHAREASNNGICDECQCQWTEIASIWACKDCVNITLCQPCYEKLKGGLLGAEICGQEHAHLHIPFLTESEMLSIPTDSMLVGGKHMHRREWVESVRQGWGIDEKSLASAGKT